MRRGIVLVALCAMTALGGRFYLGPDEANPCAPNGTLVSATHVGQLGTITCRVSVR